jgi:ElaB/YqjD/DUF883 family membrane-anchored ribosome-binding protein
MEENENNNVQNDVQNVEESTVTSTTDSTEETKTATVENNGNAKKFDGKVIVEKIKVNKKPILIALIVIIVLLVIYNCFFNPKTKVKNVVKEYYSALNKGNAKKLLKQVDPAGAYVFSDLDEDDYDDFWDEYKKFCDDDDYDDFIEDYNDNLEDEIDSLSDTLENLMDDYSVKVKSIKSVKKVSSHLYKIKVKIETKDEDGDKNVNTVTHYVMVKGLNAYILDSNY